MNNSTKVYRDSGGDRLVIDNEGTILLKEGAILETESGVGSVPVVTGLTAEELVPIIHKTVLTLDDVAITMTDNTTNGCHGGLKIYDLPAGLISVLTALTDLSVTASGSIGATAAVVGSVGTVVVANANATLTSTEADIVPSTSATLTDSVGAMDGVNTAPAVLDGTGTAKDVYLNFAVPDAGASGNGTITVSGTITLLWVNGGDL